MTCRSIKTPDGHTVIVCSRGRRVWCSTCGHREATKLCDFKFTGASAGKTCDKPLCSRCAVKMKALGDDVDYCGPHHRFYEGSLRVQAEADAWLADLIANEVDRDALFDMFPDWELPWLVVAVNRYAIAGEVRSCLCRTGRAMLCEACNEHERCVCDACRTKRPEPPEYHAKDDGCPECGGKHEPMEPCYGGLDPDMDFGTPPGLGFD